MKCHSKTDILYVRGVKVANLEFIDEMVKFKGHRYAKEYLNDLLDEKRTNWKNKKKQLKQKKTVRRGNAKHS